MGKWNYRRYVPRSSSRRKYKDYDWSPPRDEPIPDPATEAWQDNVPMWEKKFCYLVGRMPWRKVLGAKNFMHCNSNVHSWDASAGEEAFLNAKKRFWEEMNGLPSESQLPNPDMYIDEIDWDPYIDPELVKELDREYFNPDDKYYLPSTSKRNKGWKDDVSNPCELYCVQNSKVNDKGTGWNKWDNSVNDTSKLTKDDDPWENSVNDACKLTKDDDPWESQQIKGNEGVKESTWGATWNKSWDSKQNQSDTSKNWNRDGSSWRNEGKEWQDRGASSGGWNQKADFHKPSYGNVNYNSRGNSSYKPSHRNDNFKPRESVSYKPSYRNDISNWEAKDSTSFSRGRGQLNDGCRKREGTDYYAMKHKGPRLQDSESSHYWNGANNKRVSFGGQWS